VLKPHRDWLLELRRKESDLTLDAIAERLLRAHGVAVDKSMLSRFFAAEEGVGPHGARKPRGDVAALERDHAAHFRLDPERAGVVGAFSD
jgi:hypothetical protein